MDDETLDRIRKLTDELDAAVPGEGAGAEFLPLPGASSADECYLRANRLGFLRLAVEFLKAGLQPADPKKPDEPTALKSRVDDILTDQSFVRFHGLELTENLDAWDGAAVTWRYRLLNFLGVFILAAVIILAFVGLVHLIS